MMCRKCYAVINTDIPCHYCGEDNSQLRPMAQLEVDIEGMKREIEARGRQLSALEAYLAKLEEAGDAMRRSSWINFRVASFAWDAARKEKP